ncbi:Sodium- and chloride-dependent GABA transporter 2 [Mizuhopecten yessoensis]|uniref:Sodium-and chloride-dependent GABA transporter 2 n=1 Tax=Mizuhopecten yessoensis TaxID=6573 RepID=A0A210PK70_MIZYE|nr:Sodium- and chloride-dependent GABA transporter 2 [Mizuhopecten yessoensis]
MTLGSYKKFNDNFYRDSIVIMCINSGTSILGGFAVFSVLGFMARNQGVDISDISNSGTALAFLTYPKAVSLMPGASFWAVLFFFMLFLVGMDSLFLGVEVAVTMMVDALPERYQKKWSRMVLTAVYSFALFLVGLSMTTRVLFISQLTSLRLDNLGSSYSYPPLAQAFGLMLSLSSMVCVPVVMVYKLMGISGSFSEVSQLQT